MGVLSLQNPCMRTACLEPQSKVHNLIGLPGRYESRLATERDNCVRLQGENGLLRQKFQSALADVTQLQDQIKALEVTKTSLQNVGLYNPIIHSYLFYGKLTSITANVYG